MRRWIEDIRVGDPKPSEEAPSGIRVVGPIAPNVEDADHDDSSAGAPPSLALQERHLGPARRAILVPEVHHHDLPFVVGWLYPLARQGLPPYGRHRPRDTAVSDFWLGGAGECKHECGHEQRASKRHAAEPTDLEGGLADPGGRWRSRPVSRILCPVAGKPAGRWRPSLWEPRRRDPRAAYPGASGGPPAPCSALLRVGFTQPAGHPAAGELLPHRFTLAPVRDRRYRARSRPVGGLSLWHFPRVTPPGRCPAPCPVESGLSSANASPRPPGRLLQIQV